MGTMLAKKYFGVITWRILYYKEIENKQLKRLLKHLIVNFECDAFFFKVITMVDKGRNQLAGQG